MVKNLVKAKFSQFRIKEILNGDNWQLEESERYSPFWSKPFQAANAEHYTTCTMT